MYAPLGTFGSKNDNKILCRLFEHVLEHSVNIKKIPTIDFICPNTKKSMNLGYNEIYKN